ncbi:sigma-54-dependent Fis family transcriptional regulator [Methylonatrum kenyense]|uniref:sigma-54-dependent Fis family transcriptional regulator n=1 Tax=Methylonatrum kenyense TaxID=455253 RepID=UPI0020C03281|nr:sigma-54-dependent Fis family transcriptional regulator [Methylonatrum kenyense]MCK8516041.1 sigma-54-dependent Fis family transcriptional regulator [Methylonatrum kenyense]
MARTDGAGQLEAPLNRAAAPNQRREDGLRIIRRSWERCNAEYGIDRVANHPPAVVDSPHLVESKDQYGELVQVARTEMQSLYQQIAGSGYALLLTDACGMILEYVGEDNLKGMFRDAGLLHGAIWDEAHEGTNGIGTCIAESRPVNVFRDQHFRARHQPLSCSGAPIWDPEGKLLAVLDASTVSASDTPQSQLHTLALVTMSAQLISKTRFTSSFRDALILRFHSRPEYVGLINDGALAVSGDGRIIAADHNAVGYLGARDRVEIVGRRISDVLDIQPTTLRERASRPSMPYWPVYGKGGGARFYATVLSPARDGLPGDRLLAREQRPVSRAQQRRFPADLSCLAGQDPTMQENIDCAQRVMDRDIPILLIGETGTGKELFARAVHEASSRSQRRFVAVNCAAIPESLIESELFGYKPGAFTGAQRGGNKGRVLEADGGTLFLDEIGDMPLELQTRLLRVLEEQEVVPLGGGEPLPVEISLVSATNSDLEGKVASGAFREDLYYRLNGICLQLPALRERHDMAEIIHNVLEHELDSREITISPEAFSCLMAYHWPGNLRQLRNVLRTALALCRDGVIRREQLSRELRALQVDARPEADNADGATSTPGRLDAAERAALLAELNRQDWNVTRTAAELDMSRNTLYRKMRKHGISPPA